MWQRWIGRKKPGAEDYNGALWTGPLTEVLVWTFDLDEIDSVASAGVLAADERARAARFRFDIHRNRFIAGRALLRHVLAELTGTPPETIEFVYGEHGKPAIKAGGLHFNLSHAENRAIIGVTQAGPVGVDIERMKPDRARPEIAGRFFAPQETQALAGLSGDVYANAFFQIWSRKEAVLKAVGTGIGGGLSSFSVPSDELPAPVHIPTLDCWIGNLTHAFPYLQTEGFSSAVALVAKKPLVRPVCATVLKIPVRRNLK